MAVNPRIVEIGGLKYINFNIGNIEDTGKNIIQFLNLYKTFYKIKNSIEVGSKVGYYTLVLSKMVEDITYAFEPQSSNFNFLNVNARLNNITNITSFNLACGDIICNIQIKKPPIVGFSNLVNENYSISQARILDMMRFPQIDLIKINSNGFEKKVLMGATDLLKKYKPIIIIDLFKAGSSTIDLKKAGSSTIDLKKAGSSTIDLKNTSDSDIDIFEFIRRIKYYMFYISEDGANAPTECGTEPNIFAGGGEYNSTYVCVHIEKLADFRNKFNTININGYEKIVY